MSKAVRMSSKAWKYQCAVHDFFDKISDIAYIDGLKFEKSTSNRIYFYIYNVAHWSYGTNYELHVFVRKKDLSVEIYDPKTGAIITNRVLQLFKNDSEIALNDLYPDDED